MKTKVFSTVPTMVYIAIAAVIINWDTPNLILWGFLVSAFVVAKIELAFMFMSGHGLRRAITQQIVLYIVLGIIGVLLGVILWMPWPEGFESAKLNTHAIFFPAFFAWGFLVAHWFFWMYWETKYSGWEYDARKEFQAAGYNDSEIEERISKLHEIKLERIFREMKSISFKKALEKR